MAKKSVNKKSKKQKKRETNKQKNTRKKSLTYTLTALGFILLTLFWNWLFIIPALFFLYLGRRYLLN